MSGCECEEGAHAPVRIVWLRHHGRAILLVSRVTEPSMARTWPLTVTPMVTVMEIWARTLPAKSVSVPRVAELPISQMTFLAVAPLMRSTWLAVAVVRVDPIWKIHLALRSPWASSVSVLLSPMEEAAL